jgi:uncharacterized protein
MLTIISPAKTLDFESKPVITEFTLPELLGESEKLVAKLQKIKPKKLAELMNISSSLANLNYDRFQNWHPHFSPDNAKQAVLSFNGEVYAGLKATTLAEEKLLLSQNKLRILSGLYGVLRPLDLIQPYRLEMGTPLKTGRKTDLYSFWGDKITKLINQAIDESGSRFLVNLASEEYFKSIDKKKVKAEIIAPTFKDMKNGEYKFLTLYAKKARGAMTRFILENEIGNHEDLQAFDTDGYHFNSRLSTPGRPVFTRG